MKKRILSMLLCISLIFITFAQSFILAIGDPRVHIEYKDSEVTTIIIEQDEKKTVTAVCTPGGDDYSFSWQILADFNSQHWVDITGYNKKNADLSAALLYSLLDDSGYAYVRCSVSDGTETLYSNPLSVTVAMNAQILSDTNPQVDKVKAVRKANRPKRASEEYVYITINYLDAVSKESLYSSYTSQLQNGLGFNQIVLSPTFLGFAPYYSSTVLDTQNPEEATENATHISLDIASVTQDLIVNVYYKPIEVGYTVHYFFQNINNDFYTERTDLYYSEKALTGTIILDSEINERAGNPVGFTALYHYPESVAADGSTSFECYFDRNYYLIKFDMAGGYGVEPIYARYDTPFVINDPTRHGYIFSGWDLITDENPNGDGNADILPGTIPAENRMYRALWQNINAEVTIAYWRENPDWVADPNDPDNITDKYYYWSERVITAKSGTVINGEDYKDLPGTISTTPEAKRHTYDFADYDVLVNGDNSTVVNVYYKPNEYTLQFFYARSNLDRTNYEIVGGSTYAFGNNAPETYTLEQLLANVKNGWGSVKSLPSVKSEYPISSEDYGTVTSNNKLFYYFKVRAKYGQNLNNIWPTGVFEPAEISEAHSQCGTLDKAYFSAWNGEKKVRYSQINTNQTIKGLYQRLDDNLLYNSKYTDSSTVSYLAFWENGASVGWSKPIEWIYELYVEDENGTFTYGGDTATKYSLSESVVTYDNNAGIADQTATAIAGYTYVGRAETKSPELIDTYGSFNFYRRYAGFYYNKNNYKLSIFNADQETLVNENVKFATSLDEYISKANIEENYPTKYEANAYRFEGWYLSPTCAEMSRYTPGATMPAHNMSIYANWVPLIHTVRSFKSYSDMMEYENGNTTGIDFNEYTVSHRDVITNLTTPPAPTVGDLTYTFGGWFYIRNGSKVAFTPLDSPVIRDLNIFADWGSNTAQPYSIHYVLKNSLETKIAEDTFGYAFQGTTRTFKPKSGDPYRQLYTSPVDYNEGYFPTLGSHSITVQYEEDKENPQTNTFTFEYVHAERVPYMVRYVTNLGEELGKKGEDGSLVTNKAIITERFLPFDGYVPDSFYISHTMTVNIDDSGNVVSVPQDNVITFIYSKNDTTAFYAVHNMLQKPGTSGSNYKIDGTGDYTENSVHTEGIADIGGTLPFKPQVFSGYSVVTEKAIVVNPGQANQEIAITGDSFQFVVSKDGTEIYIFHKLKSFNYVVKYLNHDGNIVISEQKVGTAQYGTTVLESAISIEGFNLVSEMNKSITIKSFNDGSSNPNEIIFYYIYTKYDVEYKVANNIGGKLSNGIDAVVHEDDAYTFNGSVPTAQNGFKFDGWYKDEACTSPVNSSWVNSDTGKLVPRINELVAAPQINTFYAKFTELKGDLTISRANAADEGNGDQVFVYKATNIYYSDITVYVTITGNRSVTIKNLRAGSYSVEQINNWSWRYSDTVKMAEAKNSENTTTEFGTIAAKNQWLNGNSNVKVNVKE